jgi:selenium metabolism protein YedF
MQIDCRGLNCPEPVLRTKKALEEGRPETLTIIVDNETARENVLRFVRSRNRAASWKQEGDLYQITVSGEGEASTVAANKPRPGRGETKAGADKLVILIYSEELGQGSSELGRLLMRNFIYTLTRQDELPEAIIFMNAGVKLCIEGSPVVEELSLLQENGTQILACGTCLDYYGVKEKLAAGQVSNMYDIADLLGAATRTITL